MGGQKAKNLAIRIESHINDYGDNEVTQLGLSVLVCYMQDEKSDKAVDVVSIIEPIIKKYFKNKYTFGGVKPITFPDFTTSTEDILDFYKSRSSVRYFSKEKVTDDEIQLALKVASFAPTSCNRQTSKVYVIKERSIMEKLLDLQGGDQGWQT